MANREEQIKTKKNQIFLGQQCFQVYSFKFNLAPRVLPGRVPNIHHHILLRFFYFWATKSGSDRSKNRHSGIRQWELGDGIG
jgi:hypothetical protein